MKIPDPIVLYIAILWLAVIAAALGISLYRSYRNESRHRAQAFAPRSADTAEHDSAVQGDACDSRTGSLARMVNQVSGR